MTDVTCHVTAVKSEMTYALLLPVVVAAAVMVRAYDICHVTSVTKCDVEGVWVCYKNLTHFIAVLSVLDNFELI